MFKSMLLWRMAARNTAAQKGQTLLTLLGGSVGVMLAVAAVVFWTSFDESGMRWLRAHFGVIDWELRPAESGGAFTSEQTRDIARRLGDEYRTYPAVVYTAEVRHEPAGKAAQNLLVVGIGADSPLLPVDGASIAADDRVVVSVSAADRLQAWEGDVLTVVGADGEERLFKVSLVAEEAGLTGYRGMERAAGTLIMNENAARSLAGLAESSYNTIFASRGDTVTLDVPDVFPVYFPDIPYTALEPKKEAVGAVFQLKSQYGTTFLVASALAVAAGLVLMRELFLMLADQRRVRLAALRAIGFSRRDVGRIFLSEAVVLNAGAVLAGTALGIALGYGLLALFRSVYLSSLQRFATTDVPIEPHLAVPHIALAAAALFAANLLVALLAARAAARVPIAATLRGDARPGAGLARGARRLARLQTAVSAAILAAFVYLAASGEALRVLGTPSTDFPPEIIGVLAVWLAAPFALLFLFTQTLGPLSRAASRLFALLRVPRLPVLLALRYPQRNRRRVFSVSALFAIVGMMITAVLTVGGVVAANMEQEGRTANLLGSPAYIPYADEAGKKRLLDALDGAGFALHPLDTYRLNIEAPGVLSDRRDPVPAVTAPSSIAVNVVSPAAPNYANADLALTARAPGFASDEDVWRELLRNPDAVVLHKLFSYTRDEWGDRWWAHSFLPDEPIEPGDSLDLLIYPKSEFVPPFTMEKEEPLRRTVTVLGFFEAERGIEFFQPMLVSPQFFEEYRDRGFQWPNTPHLGYLMIGLDTSDLAAVERLEDTVLLGGVKGLRIPALEQLGSATLLRHTLSIYVAFMVAAALIGLAGFAIVQMRAIREREAQIGMLRCLGVRKADLAAMFLIEGSLVGSIGLLVGWGFGSIGGYWIYRLSANTANPLETPPPYHYPGLALLLIFGAILLAALALNAAPALRSLSLSPGAAVRAQD